MPALPLSPHSGRPLTLACILAAGRGTRLGAAGEGRPKGFLCLGERPIVVESMERLRRCGVQRIVIVTGYGSECYEALQEPGLTLVHNPRFAETGSLWSLCCARAALDDDFLLLESDLVYEQRALDTLQREPGPNAVLTSGFTGSGDEVYVAARDGRLTAMSKCRQELAPDPIVGEMAGMCRISRELYRHLVTTAEELMTRDPASCYETDGLVACASRVPIACPVVEDLLWGEIDDLSHLERVRRTIYPALA